MPRGVRKGSSKKWRDLSDSYRGRLEAKGIGYREWLRGDDLRGARGHSAPVPKGAAPKRLRDEAVSGDWTPREMVELSRWQETTAPEWIRDADLSSDVAAALSYLPPPDRWKDAQLIPRSGDEPWTLVVQPKGNGYPISIEVPGGGGPGSGAREVIEFLRAVEAESWTRGSDRSNPFEFEIFDTQ